MASRRQQFLSLAQGQARSASGVLLDQVRSFAGGEERNAGRFIRATPSTIRFTESYAYELLVAQPSDSQLVGSPTGRLLVRVPYDGQRCFSHEAASDAERCLDGLSDPRDGRIGHLAFAEHRKARIEATIPEIGRCSTAPLDIPIRDDQLSDIESLTSDRHELVMEQWYEPEPPDLVPLAASLAVYETKQFDHEGIFLVLGFQVTVPESVVWNPSYRPRLANIELLWPGITSPSQVGRLWLLCGHYNGLGDMDEPRPVPLSYDPTSRSVKWSETFGPDATSGWEPIDNPIAGHRSYQIQFLMWLAHPSQLADVSILEGQVDIRLDGLLLSEMRAQAYSTTGVRSQVQPGYETQVKAKLRYLVDDAIRKRLVYQSNELIFPGVLPEVGRIDDIRDILRAHQFTDIAPAQVENGGPNLFGLVARLPHGPEHFLFKMIVEQRTGEAVEQGMIPTAGIDHTSPGIIRRTKRETGEIRLHMEALIRGDHQHLNRKLNLLHQALREQFEHFTQAD